LTTIKDSDKILVFDKGAVVEEGNHEELLDLRHNLIIELITLS
jgi:ABC-type multidrug transport system fused ATPase/permease subunit